MASEETWSKLRYFKPDSNDSWGDASAISDDLLLVLDDFRHYLGCPVIITRGVAEDGHSSKSYHYREQGACAIDCIIPDYQKGALNLLFDVFRFSFTGVGYYPHWQYDGRRVGGLHLDVRPLKWEKDFTLNYQHSRWLGVKDSSGNQVYIPMTVENLMNYQGENKLWIS